MRMSAVIELSPKHNIADRHEPVIAVQGRSAVGA